MKFKQAYLLGIDVGTSETHALITDLDGKAVGYGESGCGNYEVVGEDGLVSALHEALNSALQMGNIDKAWIVSMGFGISGYDWPTDKPVMERAIATLDTSCPYRYENDAVIGLIAGSSNGWGVAVGAGTGNNVRGRDQFGREGRITGNSAWMGELGGGGEMVWLATIAVTYAWTTRGPKTKITQLFLDFHNLDNEQSLIEGLAKNKLHLPPVLAIEIINLACENDSVAKEIVLQSAQSLGHNTNAVIRQLNLQGSEFEVVMFGSIFKAGDVVLRPFKKVISDFAPKASFVHLSAPPVTGAVLLAAEEIGITPNNIRQNLIKSVQNLVDNVEMNG